MKPVKQPIRMALAHPNQPSLDPGLSRGTTFVFATPALADHGRSEGIRPRAALLVYKETIFRPSSAFLFPHSS